MFIVGDRVVFDGSDANVYVPAGAEGLIVRETTDKYFDAQHEHLSEGVKAFEVLFDTGIQDIGVETLLQDVRDFSLMRVVADD